MRARARVGRQRGWASAHLMRSKLVGTTSYASTSSVWCSSPSLFGRAGIECAPHPHLHPRPRPHVRSVFPSSPRLVSAVYALAFSPSALRACPLPPSAPHRTNQQQWTTARVLCWHTGHWRSGFTKRMIPKGGYAILCPCLAYHHRRCGRSRPPARPLSFFHLRPPSPHTARGQAQTL
jgi:hypothetical protein